MPVAPAVMLAVATVNFNVATVATTSLKGLNEPCLLGRYGHYIKIDNHYNGHYNGNNGHYRNAPYVWAPSRLYDCRALL